MPVPFIGEVDLYGFNFVPQDWAECTGAVIPISQNQALYSLLGTMYGGDGRSTFALPDLRGKLAVSMGEMPGSQFNWKVGQKRGSETHTLTVQEMAEHAHVASFTASGGSAVDIQVSTDAATQNVPTAGSYLAANAAQSFYGANSGTAPVSLGGISGGGGGKPEGTVTVLPTGSNRAFSIMEPIQVLNYCIAMQGIFPSRN
ncbi:phage tail protein [Motilimonas eburnea]|uniref:phage tail protein n=1 Tax=Motilimonas eburnea TaxID=1737488 RepID=UPI001E4387D2|nr:tail fiber protein [Motilimonas eburnea]MCE2571196.1 tail fiber protein [Motilimonas eburnea]